MAVKILGLDTCA